MGPGSCGAEGVSAALVKGARAIELDVFCNNYSGGHWEAVVSHGMKKEDSDPLSTGKQPFEHFITVIAEEGWKNMDDPPLPVHREQHA